ncbi:hypothetical protein LVD15_17450 [Fulvivirga maritima]|uniref:hypothetical protein n=1 Tax=Fulvivirga maritima TaxID=2904247 RepID=UPI001F3CBDED|nr:hypothetical protein [Fulvivirga maritima]UII25086.1 hypothetical protein LVD15_17450 [Fulvivirga maritima]
MKKLTLLSLSLLLCLQLYAQKDKIFLKNNGVVKGRITSIDDNIYLDIENSKLVIPKSAIEHVNMSVATKRAFHEYKDSLKFYQQKPGFLPQLQVSGIVDTGEDNHSSAFAVNAIGLYAFRPYVQLGLSAGYESYDDFEAATLSLYYKAAVRNYINSPFIYASLGESKAWKKPGNTSDEIEGKTTISAGFGLQWRVESFLLMASVGWKQFAIEQTNKYYYNDVRFANSNTTNKKINMISFNFGIGLN